jgi:hypothetical protein
MIIFISMLLTSFRETNFPTCWGCWTCRTCWGGCSGFGSSCTSLRCCCCSCRNNYFMAIK